MIISGAERYHSSGARITRKSYLAHVFSEGKVLTDAYFRQLPRLTNPNAFILLPLRVNVDSIRQRTINASQGEHGGLGPGDNLAHPGGRLPARGTSNTSASFDRKTKSTRNPL